MKKINVILIYEIIKNLIYLLKKYSFQKVNSKEYLDKVLSVAKDYLSPIEFDLLRLSLSLRTYSPAIEMSRKVTHFVLKFKSHYSNISYISKFSSDKSFG
jgi:hypothetical protein